MLLRQIEINFDIFFSSSCIGFQKQNLTESKQDLHQYTITFLPLRKTKFSVTLQWTKRVVVF